LIFNHFFSDSRKYILAHKNNNDGKRSTHKNILFYHQLAYRIFCIFAYVLLLLYLYFLFFDYAKHFKFLELAVAGLTFEKRKKL